jgi:hypothetical protein
MIGAVLAAALVTNPNIFTGEAHAFDTVAPGSVENNNRRYTHRGRRAADFFRILRKNFYLARIDKRNGFFPRDKPKRLIGVT